MQTETQSHAQSQLTEPVEMTAVCPDCGAAMTRHREAPQHWECGDCGAKHQIEVMSADSMRRQQGRLHRRGVDRLIGAILQQKEGQ